MMNNDLSFLPDTATPTQKKWHLEHNIFETIKCPVCKIADVKWNRSLGRYYTYCSRRCRNLSPEWKQQISLINQQKYGVDNVRKSSVIKEKIRNTKIKKYGSMNNYEKIKQTCLEKYGVDNVRKSSLIKQKIKETNKQRYGEDYWHLSEQGKQHILQTLLLKYGVDNYRKSEIFKQHIKNINLKKYGVNHHSQRHYDNSTLLMLENKELLYNMHHNEKKSAQEIADSLNVDQNTILRWFKIHNIECRRWFTSTGQKEIAEYIRTLNVEVIENDRQQISPYELDVFIPKYNIAIEFCGLFWHNELHVDKNYHLSKLERCNKKQIRLITIFEDEWNNKQEIIKKLLAYLMNQTNAPSVGARECSVTYLTSKQKKQFLETNHILGNGRSSYDIGLVDKENQIVACLSVLETKKEIIINRFCTSKQVVGGFSKLLKVLEKDKKTSNKPIVTFADRRFSEGQLYLKTGFELLYVVKPDYYYVHNSKRFHKFNFRHKALRKKLDKYDSSLSEVQNCYNNGIFRIWNCGLLKFVRQNQQ